MSQSLQLSITNRRQLSMDDRLIPLINIVFLLLIFFMIAGQISQQQNQQIRPPLSDSPKEAARPDWMLEVDAGKAMSLNGDAVTLAELPQVLSARSADHTTQQMALKMDRSLRAEDLDEVLNLLRSSGEMTVTLLTQAQEH